MKDNDALTRPAARLVTVSHAIDHHLARAHGPRGRALRKYAARALLLSMSGSLNRPTQVEQARASMQRCFDELKRLEAAEACDPGVLHKALTLADTFLRALPQPEPETHTAPLSPRSRPVGVGALATLIPLAVTGSRSP